MHCFRTLAVRRMDRARRDSGASQLRRERPFASELLRAALRRWRWRCRWTLPLPVAGTGRRSSRCRPNRVAWSCARCSVAPVPRAAARRRATTGWRRACTRSSATCSGSATRDGRRATRRRSRSSSSGSRRSWDGGRCRAAVPTERASSARTGAASSGGSTTCRPPAWSCTSPSATTAGAGGARRSSWCARRRLRRTSSPSLVDALAAGACVSELAGDAHVAPRPRHDPRPQCRPGRSHASAPGDRASRRTSTSAVVARRPRRRSPR